MDPLKFLTKEDFPYKRLIKILETSLRCIDEKKDEKILNTILSDFKSGNFELLSSQEKRYLKLHGKKHWAEYLIFRWKFKNYPNLKIIPPFPLYLLIEPTSICNIRCSICFQQDKSFSSNRKFMGKMDFNLFTRIIDEAVEGGTKSITFASRGEPTLHPKFGDMLRYCSGKFYELKVNTNATLLGEKLIHQILESDIDILVFSVDSYLQEDYENIRGKGTFEKVVANIKKFREIKKKFYPNSKCVSRIHGVKIIQNLNYKLFHDFWKEYCDSISIDDYEKRLDTYNNPLNTECTNPCNFLWERMYIWYDGTCNPCDVDYKSFLVLGSVREKSIAEIWNGDKFTNLRNAHIDGSRNTYYPCDRCYLWT